MPTWPRILFIFIAISLGVIMSGCKKEVPNPELLDPIYKDLKSEVKSLEKEIKETTATLEDLHNKKKDIPPRSLEKKISQREIKKYSDILLDKTQKLKYYEIRTERRRVESRRNYKIAFRKNEPWPDPEEYQNYLVHKRLKSAPINWNSRVPKLFKENPNYKEK